MYLFDKKDSNIEVYSMEPNIGKIYDFRKKEMEKIPENERVLKMISNIPMDWSEHYIGIQKFSIDNLKKKKIFSSNYYNLEQYNFTDEEKERQNKLLEEYYRSNDHYYKIKIINGLQTIKNLLTDNTVTLNNKNNFIINNIISIPESVLLLEFLLSYDFQLINKEDISEQLKLFDFSNNPIENINFSQIQKYIDLGIISFDAICRINSKKVHL